MAHIAQSPIGLHPHKLSTSHLPPQPITFLPNPGALPHTRGSQIGLHQAHLEADPDRLLGAIPRVCESIGLQWSSIICISNVFPGDTAYGLSYLGWHLRCP